MENIRHIITLVNVTTYWLKVTRTFNCPESVIKALKSGHYQSYWVESASYKVLQKRIVQPISGLRETILQMLAGASITIDSSHFTNAIAPSTNLDDELTLLVHLGYLAYDASDQTVRIPNHEIRSEFLRDIVDEGTLPTLRIISESNRLLHATWNKDTETVALGIQAIHQIITDPKHYNNERDLTAVVRAAYLTSLDQYFMISELPGGKGFADLVFIPKRNSSAPLMIVELKWNKKVNTAIDQILLKNYPAQLKEYGGPVLLVGITYNAKTGKHNCSIEELTI